MNQHELEIVLKAIERGASDVWWADGAGSGMEIGGGTTYIVVFYEGAEYCRWYYDISEHSSSWDQSSCMFSGPDILMGSVKKEIKYMSTVGLA